MIAYWSEYLSQEVNGMLSKIPSSVSFFKWSKIRNPFTARNVLKIRSSEFGRFWRSMHDHGVSCSNRNKKLPRGGPLGVISLRKRCTVHTGRCFVLYVTVWRAREHQSDGIPSWFANVSVNVQHTRGPRCLRLPRPTGRRRRRRKRWRWRSKRRRGTSPCG